MNMILFASFAAHTTNDRELLNADTLPVKAGANPHGGNKEIKLVYPSHPFMSPLPVESNTILGKAWKYIFQANWWDYQLLLTGNSISYAFFKCVYQDP